MNKDKEFWEELNLHTQKIIESDSDKKLIIAGPGTGKTTSFKSIISSLGINKNKCLVLTFINNLKSDLEKDLSGLAKVFTFHGYCHYVLHSNANYRISLSGDFIYFPKIIEVIKSAWEIFNETESPQFIKLMRTLNIGEDVQFFIETADYYDTVGYDDSVFRVHQCLFNDNNQKSYKLVIVDEYQDFNLLEVSLLKLISQKSPILITGDDDQALYLYLRNSDPKHIRDLFYDEDYKKFTLPYCTRCTEVIVNAFNDLLKQQNHVAN